MGIFNLHMLVFHAATPSDASVPSSSELVVSKSNFSQAALVRILSLISPMTASLVSPFANGSTRYFCAASLT